MILKGSSGNQGSRRDAREEGGRHRLGLHRGNRIGALLGDFFPLKTDHRDNLGLDHLAGDHPKIIVMGWTALGVLDPRRGTTGEQLGLLDGNPQGNREGLDRNLIHLIQETISGQPSKGTQHRNSSFF